ncbi:hypothetical protein LOTGIDRAFT_166235 [Lottia gigantea]|uniref:ERCC4 domain-containing protein n=1 Tax=Lottia gigantea TaxID=225164 RepID=V4BFG0_LOTGI|nr:hypothetical protein LOTGIDRAFT_166235 [Lottia gigantea]ESO87654.1 hypothetical protein LOTGIDRAFT_166235 [Lottia gigantea]
MKMFLNEDDLIRCNRDQSGGIKQYCKPKYSTDKDKTERERKRYSDILPDIEVEEFDKSDDSTNELPQFESVGLKSDLNPELAKDNISKVMKSSKKKKRHRSSVERSVHFTEPLEIDDDFEDGGVLMKSNLQTSFKTLEKSPETPEKSESDNDVRMISPDSTPVKDSVDDIELPSRGRCYVKTPPPIEEVAAIFDKLGDTEVPYVNIVELVDKWHAEDEIVSTSHDARKITSKPKIYDKSRPKMSVCTSPMLLRNDNIRSSIPDLAQPKTSLSAVTNNDSTILQKFETSVQSRPKFNILSSVCIKDEDNEEFCDIIDSQEACDVPFKDISNNSDAELPSIKIRHRPSSISPKVLSESKSKHSSRNKMVSNLSVKTTVLDTQNIEEFDTEIDRATSSPLDINMCNSERTEVCKSTSLGTVKSMNNSVLKSTSPNNSVQKSTSPCVVKTSSSFVDAEMFNDSMFEKDLTLPPEFKSHHELDGTQFNLTQALSFLDKTDSSFRTQTEHKMPSNKCDTITEEGSSGDFSSSPVFGKSQNCIQRNLETADSQAFIPQDFEDNMTCEDFPENVSEREMSSAFEKHLSTNSDSKIILKSNHESSSDNSMLCNNQNSKVSPVFTSKTLDQNKIAQPTAMKSANESLADLFDDEIEMPQFDLGFDLEDDDDMIPPSPESNSFPHPSQNITAAKGKLNDSNGGDKGSGRQLSSLKKCPQNDNKVENVCTPTKLSSIEIGSPILDSAKKDESLSVFERIKLKNSPAMQSLSNFNKQNVVSDRVSLKCSTPLKDLCVNNHSTLKLPQSPLINQNNFESSFSILSPSSAKKPKFENDTMANNDRSNKKYFKRLPSQNIDNKDSSAEHSFEMSKQHSPQPEALKSDEDSQDDQDTKNILKQLITSTQGDQHSDDDLFEEDQDLDDFISNQREILDNIRKNNMGLNSDVIDEIETDTVRNDDVNDLNVSLKSRLSLKNNCTKISSTKTDEEDSFVINRRKRCRKIQSPEFKTPTKPARKKINPLNISSEEENEVNKILGLESLRHEEDSEDDFDTSDIRIQPKKDDKVSKLKKKKKRERGGKCMFIEDEADILDDDESTDESYDSDHQQLSGNFINDETQYDGCTQSHNQSVTKSIRLVHDLLQTSLQFLQSHNQSDMQAMYLKSVRSPINKGRYRLQYNYQHHDVYSQVPNQDENSEYLEDSFCVDNDYEDSLISPEEISVIEQKKKPKKKSKVQNLNEVKGKKRLRKMSQSSSDDEMRPVIPLTQNTASFNTSQPMTKIKKRAFFSSSEDEEQSTSKAVINSCEKSKFSNSVKRCSVDSKETNSVDKNNQDYIPKSKPNANVSSVTTKSVPCVEIPNFDLELEFLDDDMPPPPVEKTTPSTNLNQERCVFDQSSDTSKTCLSDQEKSKQERLEKQRKLQEKFKSRLEQQKASENQTVKTQENNVNGSNMSSTVISDSNIDDFIIESWPKKTAKLSILVDSREISGAQEIISNLRIKHNINVEVRQLSYCDYILSTRLAVDRQVWSEFSNGSNHSKVIERLQKMKELYDRCCLIIETDKIKTGDKTVRKQHRTKYVDQLICTVSQSDIRLLFTDSQEDTCNILVELCELESKKGLSITTPLSLNTNQQQMLKFYLSIPKVTYIQAVNFVFNFKNVSKFLNSSAKVLEINGKLSAARSTEIYNYINRKFDLQMLPTKR